MSNTISQKAAVVNEVKAILGSNFDSTIPARSQLTDNQFSTVKANVVNGIISGSISYSKDINDKKEVTSYVFGMISNHFRKAKELNGGEVYIPQSTGVRGSRDSQLSELNKLLTTYTEDSDEFGQITLAIDSRKTQLSAERAVARHEKKLQKELASIDTSVLPESVRSLAESLVKGIN